MIDQAAIRILKALVAQGFRQDDPIRDATIKKLALEKEGVDDEFYAAFVYAMKQGWLKKEEWAWTVLTLSGHTAGTKK